MKYLVDTNIISEVRKGKRCDPRVARWWAQVEDDDLYLSVLVLGEIRKGIERARPRDPRKADVLERWLETVRRSFGERVLPVDDAVAEEWGKMSAKRSLPMIDGLLAATAKARRLIFATRNVEDVADTGAWIVNPAHVSWSPCGRASPPPPPPDPISASSTPKPQASSIPGWARSIASTSWGCTFPSTSPWHLN